MMSPPTPTRPTVRLVLVIVGGLFAVSISSILIRWCHAPAIVIATYRLAIASGVLMIMAGRRRLALAVQLPGKIFLWGLLSGAFLAIHFSSWIRSLELTSVAISVVLVSTTPFFAALGSWLFLKRKPAGLFWLGLALSFVGLLLIVHAPTPASEDSMLGNGLALTGAAAMAGYILCGRYLRARLDNFLYILLAYSSAALVLLVSVQFTSFPMIGYSGQTYMLFVLIAVFPQLLGHTSFNWALKYLSAPVVSMLLLGEPVLASILAWLLLDETLTMLQIAGSVLILLGVGLAVRAETM